MKKFMWELKDLIESAESTQTECNGKWIPARPENFKPRYCSIFRRIQYAWQVIMGRAETFIWPEDQ
jgi:hypothetical protein